MFPGIIYYEPIRMIMLEGFVSYLLFEPSKTDTLMDIIHNPDEL